MNNAVIDNPIVENIVVDNPNPVIDNPIIDNDVPMEAPNHQKPTLEIHGIAIPADDFKLIFDDDIIAGYVAENEAIANLGDQELANDQNQAQELPNLDKFSNIPRPHIATNLETLARKGKSNGFQSKPTNKAVLKTQVSKKIIFYPSEPFIFTMRLPVI